MLQLGWLALLLVLPLQAVEHRPNPRERLLDQLQPDLVFYDAGVDIYAQDPLGRLAVSEQGIADRDRGVIERCRRRHIPVATVIGGGYDDDRDALARRHAIVIEEAATIAALSP